MCECCCLRYSTAAHHRTYERLGDEKDEDLIGLCDLCHKYVHGFIPTLDIFQSRSEVLKKLRTEVIERGLRDESSR